MTIKHPSFKCACIALLVISIFIELFDFFYNRHEVGEYVHDDMGLTIDELILKHGYLVENHTLTTDDGYILQMQRLYNVQMKDTKSNHNNKSAKVVLLMHGVMHSSISWITGGPKNSIAYHFADHDYDVWLGNVRGNTYSRKHTVLHPDEHTREFFNYSWHEFGVYDVPAQIDYVLNQTKQTKVFYVGHSQGFLGLLVALSEKPIYNEKIKLLVGLAPAVYLNYAYSPFIRTIAYFQELFEWGTDFFNVQEVANTYTPRTSFLTEFGHRYCHDDQWLGQHFCYFCYSLAGGFYHEQMNRTLLPLIFSHAFNGASWKQILHYTQVSNSGIFRKYDYGKTKNLIHYGRESPPEYDFNNMRVPTAIFYSVNDWAASSTDVEKLISHLPNVIHASMPDPQWAHFDFLMGTNITNFYHSITNMTARYQP